MSFFLPLSEADLFNLNNIWQLQDGSDFSGWGDRLETGRSMHFHLCLSCVLSICYYLSNNTYKGPTMCALGGAGNRGGIERTSAQHFPMSILDMLWMLGWATQNLCSGLRHDHPKWSAILTADGSQCPPWELCSSFQGSSTWAWQPKVIYYPRDSPHPITDLWRESKAQLLPMNQGSFQGPPSSRAAVGSFEVSTTTTTSWLNPSPCPILLPSFIPFQMFLVPLPPPCLHLCPVNSLYANFHHRVCFQGNSTWDKVWDLGFCWTRDEEWVQRWLWATAVWNGQAKHSMLGTVFLTRTLCVRHGLSLELCNGLWREGPFSIKMMSFSFNNRIIASEVLS